MTAPKADIARRARSVPPHDVVLMAVEDALPFDLAVPQEVFSTANLVVRRVGGTEPYRIVVAGAGPLETPLGRLEPAAGLDAVATAGTVVVPGRHVLDAPVAGDVVAALRAAHARGARMVSLCAGAFVLAASGALDGRPAATHWSCAERLAAQHPDVHVDPDVLYVDDGQVLSSAGCAAGIDLCLHLVRRDLGADTAVRVARMLVVAPYREGGQAPFIEQPVPAPRASHPSLAALRPWLLEHLDEPVTLAAVARRAGCSERTLLRRFHEETGLSPLQWLLTQRVEAAQRLLETTDLSVERVAARTGFGTGVNLRAHFVRRVGTAPSAYRRAFRGAA